MYKVVRVAEGVRLFAFALVCVASLDRVYAQEPQTPQDLYEAKIAPIFVKNCSGCHTAGGHIGGLRLDSFRTVMAGSSNGAVIMGGDPEGSAIVRAIRYTDPDLQMPPFTGTHPSRRARPSAHG